MSLDAMRSAVVAIRAGVFDDVRSVNDGGHRPSPVRPAVTPASLVELGAPSVVVLAGHAGAGASTVALAVAEALSARRQVQLVEYAAARRSGLETASSSELGVDASGWRRGRRDRIDLARLAADRRSIDDVLPPPPGPAEPAADRVLVIDAGWPAVSLPSGLGWAAVLPGGARLIVVSRVTVPAVRQTEHVLAAAEPLALLACVGSHRWPGMVTASCGPALRAARASGRAVTVPVDRRLATAGLTPDPLPRRVVAAGRALADLLTLDSPPGSDPSVSPREELADVTGAEC